MTVSLELGSAALIILDVQRDFLHADGVFARAGKRDMSEEDLSLFLDNTQRLIDFMHSQGRPVIVARSAFRPDFIDYAFGPGWAERTIGQSTGFLVEGTPGTELIDGLRLGEQDVVLTKKAHNAFHGTYLDRLLSNLAVEQCILAGGPMASTISDTARSGAALGYDIFYVRDAVFPPKAKYTISSQGQGLTTEELLTKRPSADAANIHPKGKSALVVVDVQNHFLTPVSGSEEDKQRIRDQNKIVVQNVRRLADKLRSEGVRVIWVKAGRRPDRADIALHRAREQELMAESHLLFDNTWGAELPPELVPEAEDVIMPKRGNSAFNFTPLHRTLRNLGVSHCFVVGGATGGCVASTIRDGAALGYEITTASDATYPYQSPYLEVLASYGRVISTAEIMGEVKAAPMIET